MRFGRSERTNVAGCAHILEYFYVAVCSHLKLCRREFDTWHEIHNELQHKINYEIPHVINASVHPSMRVITNIIYTKLNNYQLIRSLTQRLMKRTDCVSNIHSINTSELNEQGKKKIDEDSPFNLNLSKNIHVFYRMLH